nr:helix-turn-helix domain-containing protein [Lacisediminihabitans profunda]
MAPPGHLAVTTPARSLRGDLFDPSCPTRQLLDRVGSKWTSMVVKVLSSTGVDEVRFAELKRRMPGISQKMLAQTLRSLERDSLVERRVEATSPPRVHYRLTTLGASLDEPLAVLREWAELHMYEVEQAGSAWDNRVAHTQLLSEQP